MSCHIVFISGTVQNRIEMKLCIALILGLCLLAEGKQKERCKGRCGRGCYKGYGRGCGRVPSDWALEATPSTCLHTTIRCLDPDWPTSTIEPISSIPRECSCPPCVMITCNTSSSTAPATSTSSVHIFNPPHTFENNTQ